MPLNQGSLGELMLRKSSLKVLIVFSGLKVVANLCGIISNLVDGCGSLYVK
jgi:hypothetical protein